MLVPAFINVNITSTADPMKVAFATRNEKFYHQTEFRPDISSQIKL